MRAQDEPVFMTFMATGPSIGKARLRGILDFPRDDCRMVQTLVKMILVVKLKDFKRRQLTTKRVENFKRWDNTTNKVLKLLNIKPTRFQAIKGMLIVDLRTLRRTLSLFDLFGPATAVTATLSTLSPAAQADK